MNGQNIRATNSYILPRAFQYHLPHLWYQSVASCADQSRKSLDQVCAENIM